MSPSSSQPRPPSVGDDVLAYWYFYTKHDQLGNEDPMAFLTDRFQRVLESVADHFRPTKHLGKVRPLPQGADELRFGVEFEWVAPSGVTVDELDCHLNMASAAVREEGRPVLTLLYVTGATRLAFPRDGTMVEEFVSHSNPGPWQSTEWKPYFRYLDQIIQFTVRDAYREEVLHIAVKTDNSIWYHDWPGLESGVARRIIKSNRDRLRNILQAIRKVLPEAELDHHSEGPVPSTEDGFSV